MKRVAERSRFPAGFLVRFLAGFSVAWFASFALLACLACLACLAAVSLGGFGCAAGAPPQASTEPDPPKAVVVADAGAVAPAAPIDAGAIAAVPTSDEEVDAGAPRPSHPPVKLAGHCVDMLADAKARGNLPKEATLWQEPTQVDLDGDGADDFIYTVGANANDYSGYVYITRGTCGIMVFPWVGSTPTPTTSSTRGFLNLEIRSTCKPTCCPNTTISTWHWNGSVYAKSGSRTEKRDCSHPIGSGPFNVQQTP